MWMCVTEIQWPKGGSPLAERPPRVMRLPWFLLSFIKPNCDSQRFHRLPSDREEVRVGSGFTVIKKKNGNWLRGKRKSDGVRVLGFVRLNT